MTVRSSTFSMPNPIAQNYEQIKNFCSKPKACVPPCAFQSPSTHALSSKIRD